MKKSIAQARNDLQSLAKVAHGETAVLGFPEIPKPNNGNSTVTKLTGQLTARELEALHFPTGGKLKQQTASELCLSLKTVEKHRGRLTKKLGLHGIAGLTHSAICTGIIPYDPQFTTA